MAPARAKGAVPCPARTPQRHVWARVTVALLFCVLTVAAVAQQHRATRLGDPATRFAPPLTKPDDLRALLLNESLQEDIAAILDQAGWPGNPEDLRRAAATAEITEIRIPPGTRLPFMSSRENGKPVALRDLLWAGKEPIEAYMFVFYSNDRGYRLITPKPCSNFFVEDLANPPGLMLTIAAPAETSRCEPFEIRLAVQNADPKPQSRVRVQLALPPGARTADGRTNLTFDAGTLDQAEGREYRIKLAAAPTGAYEPTARATSAEGGTADATATTVVRTPTLAIDCQAPAAAIWRRPSELRLVLRNTGDAAESRITLALPVPAGAEVTGVTEGGSLAEGRVTWQIPELAPQASKTVSAQFTLPEPGVLSYSATAQGACAPPATTQCETRVMGVRGILLEVVDVDDPVEVGNDVTYDIRVLNQGTTPATDIRIVCALPEGQEFVSSSGATAGAAQERTLRLDPLAILAPKDTATWRVVVKAVTAADARFKVGLTSDQFAQPIEEYEATQQY